MAIRAWCATRYERKARLTAVWSPAAYAGSAATEPARRSGNDPRPKGEIASDQATPHPRRSKVDQGDRYDQNGEHRAGLRVLKAADHLVEHHADPARADHSDHRSGPDVRFESVEDERQPERQYLRDDAVDHL